MNKKLCKISGWLVNLLIPISLAVFIIRHEVAIKNRNIVPIVLKRTITAFHRIPVTLMYTFKQRFNTCSNTGKRLNFYAVLRVFLIIILRNACYMLNFQSSWRITWKCSKFGSKFYINKRAFGTPAGCQWTNIQSCWLAKSYHCSQWPSHYCALDEQHKPTAD